MLSCGKQLFQGSLFAVHSISSVAAVTSPYVCRGCGTEFPLEALSHGPVGDTPTATIVISNIGSLFGRRHLDTTGCHCGTGPTTAAPYMALRVVRRATPPSSRE